MIGAGNVVGKRDRSQVLLDLLDQGEEYRCECDEKPLKILRREKHDRIYVPKRLHCFL